MRVVWRVDAMRRSAMTCRHESQQHDRVSMSTILGMRYGVRVSSMPFEEGIQGKGGILPNESGSVAQLYTVGALEHICI
jgi:hypothetical protein